jgi:hypothetical protein
MNTIYCSHAQLYNMYDNNLCICFNRRVDLSKRLCGKKTLKVLRRRRRRRIIAAAVAPQLAAQQV